MRRMNDVRLDSKIVVNEFGWPRVVGQDAADLRRSEKNIFRMLFRKEANYRGLIGKIQLCMGSGHNPRAALALKPSHDGRAC
jgi:hypothetical protein